MYRITLVAFLLCAPLFVAGGSASQVLLAREAPSERQIVDGELGRRLDKAIQQQTSGMWWGVVLVAKAGKPILAKGYGYADYANVPNDADTLFEIASISKPVTATAIMTLVQREKLHLTTTLASLWPDLPEEQGAITVHDLLTHTSGISGRIGVPYNSPLKREAYVDSMLRKELEDEPGEEFAYSNVGYAVLAAIVEKVSKQTFEAYCQKHVFKPAGMKRTGFIGDRKLKKDKNVAGRLGATDPSHNAVNWHWGWGYRGMGGTVTTLLDLLRFDRALRGDALLDEKHKKAMYTARLDDYACGWQVTQSPSGGDAVQHSGGVQGFACQYERHLDDDIVIAVLTNPRGKPFEIAKTIRRTLWPPAEIQGRMDTRPYELTGGKAATFEKGLRFAVASAPGGAQLDFKDAKGHVAVALTLPASACRDVRRQLLAAMRAHAAPSGAPEIGGGVYLAPYRGERVLDLKEQVVVRVMPRYQGMGQDGRRVVDHRITFVVQDEAERAWPVILKMNPAAAKAIAEALQAHAK